MKQSILRARVREIVDFDVTKDQVAYAIKVGAVTRPPLRAGWRNFDESHVRQMVRFVKDRSRKFEAEKMNSAVSG